MGVRVGVSNLKMKIVGVTGLELWAPQAWALLGVRVGVAYVGVKVGVANLGR